ncbi:MAG TPA: thioredoxin domain-containing protein [Terriglobales bacterium]|nr:thioredoxin domain-containing protein [Terriglobales bacterium]
MVQKQRVLFLVLTLVLAVAAVAQQAAVTPVSAALKPPKGAKVAIVVFEDLQCPDCRRAAPLLAEAARVYKIPLVRYDFPLPMHNWSFDAHVFARYFDTKSKKLGDEFREFIFQNQPQITRENLRSFADRFAAEHKTPLPFLVDPRGELAAKVKADYTLGQRTGVSHTPTIYVVSDTTRGKPFVEVVDRSELFTLIDEMIRAAK